MIRVERADTDRAMLLVIDLQEKLLPLIGSHADIVAASVKLLDAARIFEMPVLATEQYPKGIGSTVEPVAQALRAVDARILEKPTFSACGFHPIREAIRQVDRNQVIVTGIEAHVCVQQTVLDLVAMDYDVYVCADAIGSRAALDFQLSLDRMRQAGAYVTTAESVMFELCERCDTTRFKQMIDVIKRTQ